MRLIFDSIIQASRLVSVGRFDSEADLERELALLVRAYRAKNPDELITAAFDDVQRNGSGYYSDVTDYYTGTGPQLSGVHSPDGAIHFGLDWDGRFRHDGFYEQARIISDLIAKRGARDVLELGPGKGINSVFLAEKHPDVRFTGVDLTPAHVRIASERGKHLPNLRIVEGDFHRLESVPDESIDLAFEIEAGCYSDTPENAGKMFAQLGRVLRPGGLFVAFGYVRADDFERCSENAKLALRLVARAWVIEGFVPEQVWNTAAEREGFRLDERRDLRQASMPSVLRLYRQARMFYLVMASRARKIPELLVRRSTHNAVSTLMLPYTYWLGTLEYRQAILTKDRRNARLR